MRGNRGTGDCAAVELPPTSFLGTTGTHRTDPLSETDLKSFNENNVRELKTYKEK